jgi:hypothetical protein
VVSAADPARSLMSRQALGPKPAPMQWAAQPIYRVLRWPEWQSDYSPQYSAEATDGGGMHFR